MSPAPHATAAHASLSVTFASAEGSSIPSILAWAGIFVAATVVGWIIVSALRRRAHDRSEADAQGFLLDDLRALRDAGELTADQYQRAVESMARATRQAAEKALKSQESKPS